MRYYVTLDGKERPVDVEILPTGALTVSVEGRLVEADVVEIDDGSLSIRINGQVLDLTLEGLPPEVGIVASGHRIYGRIESERLRASAAARRTKGGGNEKEIVAPMPGRVTKVLVAVGDEVAVGQGVVVVEAMKMENELRAKAGGVVAEIHAQAGATIEAGARLVTFA